MQFRYSAVLDQSRLFLGPICVLRDDFQGYIQSMLCENRPKRSLSLTVDHEAEIM